MKIETTISQHVEMEIPVPFFRKDNRSIAKRYFALIDDKTIVYMFEIGGDTNISHRVANEHKRDILEAFKEMDEISEEVFLSEHSRMLKSLSLIPVLSDPDDLKGINI